MVFISNQNLINEFGKIFYRFFVSVRFEKGIGSLVSNQKGYASFESV